MRMQLDMMRRRIHTTQQTMEMCCKKLPLHCAALAGALPLPASDTQHRCAPT